MTTPNREYETPVVGGSFDAWGTILNDSIGEGAAAPPTPPDDTTSAVPVPASAGKDLDFDVQDALNRGQQGLINAKAAQDVADAALPKTGAAALDTEEGLLTGRVDSHTGTFRMVDGPASVAGTLTLDASDSDVFAVTLTEAITTLVISNLADPALQTTQKQAQAVMLFLTSVGFAVGWSSLGTVKWTGGVEPTLSNPGEDVIVLLTQDQGVNWRGMVLQKNLL